MSLIKSQQFCKTFARLGVFHRNLRATKQLLISDKQVIIASSGGSFIHGTQPKHFSISTSLKRDTEAMNQGDVKQLVVNYEDVLAAQNDQNILIIDVREQSEIDETGKLPGSIHIPMGEVGNILTNLSEADFKNRFDREKPAKNTKIIVSCKAGRRSGAVQEQMQQMGYSNVYNYGGWLDWESNHKGV